jgi:electron transport complex protein RnfG
MKKLSSSLKNMLLSLTIVTAGSTAILAFVYQLTLKPIQQANVKNLNDAIAKVIPGFDNNPSTDTATVQLNGRDYIIYKATKAGEDLGAAVQASDDKAFHGNLTVLVGFSKAGQITGYSILQSTETPGLGLKAKDWFQKDGKGNIIGRTPGKDGLKVKKDVGGDVDAITASTITSRAFLRSVNAAYQAYQSINGHKVNGTTGASEQKETKSRKESEK